MQAESMYNTILKVGRLGGNMKRIHAKWPQLISFSNSAVFQHLHNFSQLVQNLFMTIFFAIPNSVHMKKWVIVVDSLPDMYFDSNYQYRFKSNLATVFFLSAARHK